MKKYSIIIFVVLSSAAIAQTEYDTLYSVNTTISISPSFSLFQKERYFGVEGDVAPGFSALLRTMWLPGRLLSVGILTGYVFITQDNLIGYDLPDYEQTAMARLEAVPLQVAVSMQGKVFEVGVGMGPYYMMSTIDYIRKSHGNRIELGLTFFGSYKFWLSETLAIGPELRILYLSYRGIISFMPSFDLNMTLLRY